MRRIKMFLDFLLATRYKEPKKFYMNPQFIPLSDTGLLADGRRKVIYEIFSNSTKAGYAEVEYLQHPQHMLIHKLFIEQRFQRKELGTNFVNWLITNSTHLVGTSFEWETAYGFWDRMRGKFKDRMLPPPP